MPVGNASQSVQTTKLSTASRTVFITGAGSGIRAEISFSMTKYGTTDLGLTGHRADKREQTKYRILTSLPSTTVHVIISGISSLPSVSSALSNFAAELPPDHNKIDILIADTSYANTHNALEQTRPSKLAAVKIFNYFKFENPGIRVISFHPGLPITDILQKWFDYGVEVPLDDDNPPPYPATPSGSFTVWTASPEATFLDSRLVWAAWDVDTLKVQASALEQKPPR
ncbi:hypothetical protein B0T21DRAFT_382444 [Apiosordaria backusii]|uniref:Uncharacterized protein n=1 Tax=Apiosordaria backusii TaxID=314023 RepID=A0AA40BS89_9PEZI|nr:hypothetical protein B0T21DRAFT_382444 [Apiosordaria backusii]